ncbi:MAG: UDP-N-acetylglucosamine 2-epimerase (non-hydrolyzing) [Gemmatimonadales bacterium]|jgi:UDP-N-acetylglucosamine 2-epimerase (non-hydrolysing)
MKITHVVGTRPNFMKIAPLMRAFGKADHVEQLLIHTGQHYDNALSIDFFRDLELPEPDVNLGIGSGSHAEQTGRVMIALEPVLEHARPDWVFTVGDVNSTLAAALVAAKLEIPIAHVEAGLRSHDRSMPEEVNRVLTDQLSEALFTTEPSANENLKREGIPDERVHYVGNVMIDSLDRYRAQAAALDVDEALGVEPGRYVLVTLHRPNNVDDPDQLAGLLGALGQLASYHPVIFPIHPRTARNIKAFDLEDALAPLSVLGPVGYLEFLALMERAGVVISDSGGIQEETTVLGVPCVTLRPNTERPITISEGTNRLYDGDPDGLAAVALEALEGERRPHRPNFWDGAAAERIARITLNGPAAGSVAVRVGGRRRLPRAAAGG